MHYSGRNYVFMGSEIQYGNGDVIIQFAHANAYVPECYSKMLHAIDMSKYRVFLPELRPLWDNADPQNFNNWETLANDLIKMMDQIGRKNVIGIGHSMGAIATWLASMKRPDLFKLVILIDPVILPAKIGIVNKLFPFWLKRRYLPIIKIASNRRDQWSDRQSIIDHLGSKKVYKRFDPDVWQDFLDHAIVKQDDFLTLRYPRAWEARVYGTAPNLWPRIADSKVPLFIIKAEFSDVITADTWKKLHEHLPDAKLIEMKGVGHLVPFEKPIELAELIKLS